MKKRMDEFHKSVEKIGNYRLSAQIIEKIILSKNSPNPIKNESVSLIMDFLITDYKYALDKLFGHTNIRVSVFMEIKISGESKMARVFISEFEDPNKKTTKPFSIGEGYCGIAWETGNLVSGTYKPFPLKMMFKDRRFVKRSSRSKRESILCLPVKSELDNKIAAVLSVDSSRKYEFLLKNDILEEIDEATTPVKRKIIQLMDAMYI